jgi:hypothetical protein
MHGPYHQWTRKKNGRTSTRILSDDQLADYAPWFDNHKRLRGLITELEEISLAIAENDPRWKRQPGPPGARAAPPEPEQQPPHRVADARLTCGQPSTGLLFTQVSPKREHLSRRFYSPILLFEAYAPNVPLCVPRRDSGPPPSAMRPCAGSRWRGDARTGTDGGVRRLRLHAPIWAFVAFDLRRSRCHFTFSVFPAGFGLGVLGAEGVGDALVGGVGLTVAAVRVDLEQDGDAVPPRGGRPRSRARPW